MSKSWIANIPMVAPMRIRALTPYLPIVCFCFGFVVGFWVDSWGSARDYYPWGLPTFAAVFPLSYFLGAYLSARASGISAGRLAASCAPSGGVISWLGYCVDVAWTPAPMIVWCVVPCAYAALVTLLDARAQKIEAAKTEPWTWGRRRLGQKVYRLTPVVIGLYPLAWLLLLFSAWSIDEVKHSSVVVPARSILSLLWECAPLVAASNVATNLMTLFWDLLERERMLQRILLPILIPLLTWTAGGAFIWADPFGLFEWFLD